MELPEKAEVRIILPDAPAEDAAKLDAVYEVLGECHHSGRHDEHQP